MYTWTIHVIGNVIFCKTAVLIINYMYGACVVSISSPCNWFFGNRHTCQEIVGVHHSERPPRYTKNPEIYVHSAICILLLGNVFVLYLGVKTHDNIVKQFDKYPASGINYIYFDNAPIQVPLH